MSHLRLVDDNFIPANFKHNSHSAGPIELAMLEKFKRLNYEIDADLSIYDKVATRFGSNQPRGGVVFKGPCTFSKNTLYIDSYGRGCCSNAVGNPYRKELQAKGFWNAPIPMPSDLADIYKGLLRAKREGLKIQLGLRSEIAPWMDQKYKVFQSILKMINELKLKHTIFTSSDLISHDDYVSLINPKLTTVIMRMPEGYDEMQMRDLEPGAPSLLRRSKALNVLHAKGIETEVYNKLEWSKAEELEQD